MFKPLENYETDIITMVSEYRIENYSHTLINYAFDIKLLNPYCKSDITAQINNVLLNRLPSGFDMYY